MMMGILKDSRDFLVPRFCPWIERSMELASRLEASAYVSCFFFVLLTEVACVWKGVPKEAGSRL